MLILVRGVLGHSRAVCNARLIVRVGARDLMKGINLARAAFISIPRAALVRYVLFSISISQTIQRDSFGA